MAFNLHGLNNFVEIRRFEDLSTLGTFLPWDQDQPLWKRNGSAVRVGMT